MRTAVIRALAGAVLLTTSGLLLGASARAGVVISVGVPGVVVAPPAVAYPPLLAAPVPLGVYPRPHYYRYYPRVYRPAYAGYGYGWGYGYRRAYYCCGRVWH